MMRLRPAVWQALRVMAVDPVGVGGLILRGGAGPERDLVLRALQALLPAQTPWRRLPVNVDEHRLSGGVDLGLSLAAGRPVRTAGLLAETAGGVLVVPMAERLEIGVAARLALAMEAAGDDNSRSTGRGLTIVALDEGQSDDELLPSSLRERLGLMVALCGYIERGDICEAQMLQPVPALTTEHAQRMLQARRSRPSKAASGHCAPSSSAEASIGAGTSDPAEDIAAARKRLVHIAFDYNVIHALCATAAALGLDSMRTVLQAWAVARASAALAGRGQVAQEDAEVAARLVLAPRARAIPSTPDGQEAPGDPSALNQNPEDDAADPHRGGQSHDGKSQDGRSQDGQSKDNPSQDGLSQDGRCEGNVDGTADLHPSPNQPDAQSSTDSPLDTDADPSTITSAAELQSQTLAAAKAAIPLGLLQSLAGATHPSSRSPRTGGRSTGRGAAPKRIHTSGRPLTSRRGPLTDGRRLDLLATLRAAVPWQRLRLQEREQQGQPPAATRLLLRREDVHLRRYRRPQETTTLFVVDASGSQALNRLAEAKGAVELLLADCYVRRDRVALLAFRGETAELLLSPTRSLARARRALASLPGGGGTPLAAGIEAAGLLARQVQSRDGGRAVLVFLTDARANVALDGSPGRDRAAHDAFLTARRLRIDGLQSLWIDTAPRPQPAGMLLAQAMGARYVPLPHGQAAQVYAAVSAAVSPRN